MMNFLMFTAKPSDCVLAGSDRQFYGQKGVFFSMENSLAPLRHSVVECDVTGNHLVKKKTSCLWVFLCV